MEGALSPFSPPSPSPLLPLPPPLFPLPPTPSSPPLQGSDIVMRIIHKKELGCKVTTATLLKEEERSLNLNSKRYDDFWGLIGGKKAVKCK